MLSRFALISPAVTALAMVFGLVMVRVSVVDLSIFYGTGIFISTFSIVTARTFSILRRWFGMISFGLFFLILIQSLYATPAGPGIEITAEALQLAGFLSLFFWFISVLGGYFSSTHWHHSIATLRVPVVVSGFIFGGLGAVNIIRDQAETVALLAKIKKGSSWNPLFRFRVFAIAAVPLFYASLIKLESCLHTQQQRGLRDSFGVVVPERSSFYWRPWIFVTLSAAVTILISIYG